MSVRAAAIAGLVGPVLFTTTLLALTVIQYDFLLGIGWRPFRDPAGAWPSGLALGPCGWVQTLNFVVSGTLLALFAAGLHFGTADGRGSSIGPALLLTAGVAMALMGFETDPIRRPDPRTPHGIVHDLAFVLFVLALLSAFYFLWRRFKKDILWRGHARYTLVTALLAAVLLLLPSVAYYLFLLVVLAWFEVTALRLWRIYVPSSPRTQRAGGCACR